MVGIVVVSHSAELARVWPSSPARWPARTSASSPPAAPPTARSAPTRSRVRDAIARADHGDGVVVLGDLGSAILTVRHVLERARQRPRELVDAPLVEGAVAAAVMASAGSALDEVVAAAEEARGASKL